MSEKIPKGWKWVKLGEVAEIVKDIVNPNEFDDLNYIGLEHIGQENLRIISIGKSREVNSAKYLFKPNDILFGKLRPYFRKVVKPKFNGICSTDIWVFRAKQGYDQNYLYYFLANWDFVNLASSGEGGTRMPRADWNYLKQTEWIFPPLPEQKAIAEVLSSLDDKIDLLHRQNKTLEKMAMTLFRQWFIEPTKDGLPEGWEEVSLGDIFDIGIGRTPPRKESQWFSVNQHDIRWISVKDLGSIDTYILNSSEFLKEEAVKEFNIPIIPDNTVVLSFKLTVGRIGITIGEMVSNEAIAHFKLKPDSKISSNYLYLFLKTLDFSAFGSTSSIAEAINTKIIKEIKILVPNDELITSFQSLINPVFQKIRLNTLEIQTLEKLRDTLLPKLMSGEVRVMKK